MARAARHELAAAAAAAGDCFPAQLAEARVERGLRAAPATGDPHRRAQLVGGVCAISAIRFSNQLGSVRAHPDEPSFGRPRHDAL
jgi:hypothetical protein